MSVEIEFLLGPAGSGKTFRCLEQARSALATQTGPPLLFLAPKQATFQLERQLLQSGLPGYTRLQILSFERLAEFIFEQLDRPLPNLLAEEGRVMVLRALLERRHDELHIFHASARRPGFARQLSRLLRELQNHHIGVHRLRELAEAIGSIQRLDHKLSDLAVLLEDYLAWLNGENLLDADLLLDLAAQALESHVKQGKPAPQIEALWLDGFAQMTPQERSLLAALLPCCQRSTLAFCLDALPQEKPSWYSPWALVGETVRRCHAQFSQLPEASVRTTFLPREATQSRFGGSALLQHLEKHWVNPVPFGEATKPSKAACRWISCPNPEAEATWAAREILRYVRGGGRYRDVAVLVRQLDQYHVTLRRVFARYQIPIFVDRREPVAHHPLADLTRQALRTIAFGWQNKDWFGALKTGLVPADPTDIDRLENLALARGWEGTAWQSALRCEPADTKWVESLRGRLIEPFNHFAKALGPTPSGQQLTEAVEQLWMELKIPKQLERWSEHADDSGAQAQTVHATVWHQMQEWLENVALAFAHQSMPLPQWLPILEAGLEGLTVGVIPPVLDQVLIGAIDRSRNPDLQRVFVLGMNEGIFPAAPVSPSLLTAADRELLEERGCELGPDLLQQLGHERFYGYIACTRARAHVTLTSAARDSEGTPRNPSAFLAHLQRLIPDLTCEIFSLPTPWTASEHACELIGPLLVHEAQKIKKGSAHPPLESLRSLPAFAPVLERLRHLHAATDLPQLDPALAAKLYGNVLHTSVSSLEKFATCPFRFFVDSGLDAEERDRFVLDVRQQGSFQHEVLSRFHQAVLKQHGAWRNIAPTAARQLIGQIAEELIPEFENGILTASDQNLFQARTYAELLSQFIEVIVAWFAQYEFDPAHVELGFGNDPHPLPGWEITLENGNRLMFHGRVDRIDLWRPPDSDEAACVVVDYKSSLKNINEVLLDEGIQLQLPVYLNLLKHLRDPQPVFGAGRLNPAGVFYINLRGKFEPAKSRSEALASPEETRKAAYQHHGLFSFSFLAQLDNRGVHQGDQFKYKITKKGSPYKWSQGCQEDAFQKMLVKAETAVRGFGQRIYQGDVRLAPYRQGNVVACDLCDFKSICRIDPWEHSFRVLPTRRK